MKPPLFEYRRAGSVAEAAALLAQHGGDAKLLAGGQSLVPLLNFRLLRPRIIVDIDRVGALSYIRAQEGGLVIGALTRHHALETSPLVAARFPVLAAAMGHVAHLAVRNRGTIGGSLAHADPAAELPLLAVLLDAGIHAESAGGRRRHLAREFFLGPLTTALDDDEILTEIALPALPACTFWGFAEMALRHGDFAIAAVAATVTLGGDRVAEARIAATGIGDRPLSFPAAEALLLGQPLTDEAIAAAAIAARAAVEPASDLRASADYRRHLVGVLTGRALTDARRRAGGART